MIRKQKLLRLISIRCLTECGGKAGLRGEGRGGEGRGGEGRGGEGMGGDGRGGEGRGGEGRIVEGRGGRGGEGKPFPLLPPFPPPPPPRSPKPLWHWDEMASQNRKWISAAHQNAPNMPIVGPVTCQC